MIPGGLTEARPATAEVQEIADQVKAQLKEETNDKYEEFEAVVYKTQVVAGVNYFIKVRHHPPSSTDAVVSCSPTVPSFLPPVFN